MVRDGSFWASRVDQNGLDGNAADALGALDAHLDIHVAILAPVLGPWRERAPTGRQNERWASPRLRMRETSAHMSCA